MQTMYPGMVNSPETTITNNISESDTIIYVLDPARVPELPNLMTLGTGTNAETVKVTAINDNALTVERGFQGVAKSWPAGTVIARNFTEYDYGALKDNIEGLDASKETPAGAQAKADAAEAAAKAYADQEVADLAGEGRTTETVKGNADALDAHLSEITTEEGRHGLRYWNDKLEFFDGSDWIEIGTRSYKIYGVSIDLTNSNPETAVTYTDDAVGMSPGSAWNSMPIFKDIKPCVLKNGVVQYYLNPNDLTKKADGTSADITSGNDGDVMIEIPKTGFLISTVGNILTVKVTDDPNNPNFKYYAHTRVTEGDRSKLYIGAYLGWKDGSNKLRSLSGKTPTATQTIGTFRTQAQANGVGYDIVSFYPLTLLQCLFMIKYKNRDSQTALGRGYVDGNSAAIATGGTNAKGIDFGETSGKQQMCFLNIEDMWGNLRWFIDGLFSDANRNMLTAFTGFNDTGSGYTNRGQGATSDIGNYMSKPQGTTEAGFVAKEVTGSATTHFTDYADLNASRLPTFGGSWTNGDYAGVFSLSVNRAADTSDSYYGARLMYL